MVRSPCFDQNGMKKGAWSEEEDNKLRAYVRRYGHWNWRQLPKFAGLKRCGKSCRLRWLNYLKPGVRRGNYTPQEEELILELHRQFGSKWSVIAARLPGRVDNDIKNHWNSHLRRKMKFHPVEDLISQSPTDESLISHLMNQDEVDSDSSSVSDCEIARVSSLRYDSTLVLQEYPAKDEDITPTESNVGLFWPHIFASNDGNGDPVHLQLPVVLQEEVMGTFTSYLDETNIDNWLHELLQSDGIY